MPESKAIHFRPAGSCRQQLTQLADLTNQDATGVINRAVANLYREELAKLQPPFFSITDSSEPKMRVAWFCRSNPGTENWGWEPDYLLAAEGVFGFPQDWTWPQVLAQAVERGLIIKRP